MNKNNKNGSLVINSWIEYIISWYNIGLGRKKKIGKKIKKIGSLKFKCKI